jgi:hypothetical protein
LESRPSQAEAAPPESQQRDRPPAAFAIFRQSKRMMEAREYSPERSLSVVHIVVHLRFRGGYKNKKHFIYSV